MAENINIVPEATEPQETTNEKTSIRQKIKTSIDNHPRIAKVAATTAAALAVVGVVMAVKNMNDDEVLNGELLALDAPEDVSYLDPETTTVAEA